MRSCYALVRSVTKPRQPGGLSHVKIPNPDNTQWESIYKPKALEEQILKQHRKHFSQAAGTVFTCDPLQTLIDDECTSEFAKQVLIGNADIASLPIDEYTKDLLCHLKTKIPPTENPANPLDTEDLIQGFKWWPERTTTSPSGRHLGIYKETLPTTKQQKQPRTNHRTTRTHQVRKRHTESSHHDDGTCSNPHPHLRPLENNINTAVRKRCMWPQDRPLTYHSPVRSRLQPSAKMVLFKRVHDPQWKSPTHNQQ